jgi:hypothetical protein
MKLANVIAEWLPKIVGWDVIAPLEYFDDLRDLGRACAQYEVGKVDD